MGVTAVTERYTQRGGIDAEGNREYTTLYQVEVDSIEVGVKTVLEGKIEDAYHIPRGEWEKDPMKDATPSIRSDSYLEQSHVTAGGTADDNDDWGQGGNKYAEVVRKEASRSEDPKLSLCWDVLVTWRWIEIDQRWYCAIIPQIDREIVEDAYVDLGYAAGGNPAGVTFSIPGRDSANSPPGPVVNLAGEVLDPPIERERNRMVIRMTRLTNDPTRSIFDWEMAVNTDSVKLELPVGYAPKRLPVQRTYNFRPWELRVRSVNLQEVRYNSRHYFRETWEIAYKNRRPEPNIGLEKSLSRNPGWRVDVLNAGVMQRVVPGKPAGRPGQIAPGGGFSENDIRPGTAPHVAIRGSDGKPIKKPMMLDEQGQPIWDFRYSGNNTIYVRYIVYRNERAFNSLPFFQNPNAKAS